MAAVSQNLPMGLNTASRRSGFSMQPGEIPLQNWIAAQHTQVANRRPAVKSLPFLKEIPYNAADWKRVLAEVKGHYANKRYRPCSFRCIELLKNAKASDNAEPAYLIYLHFYAATSLEMQARSLHAGSPSRVKLLEQAREHYNLASQKAKAADEQALHMSLRPVSPSSSLPSPLESCLSHQSTSTSMSSPTLSAVSSGSSPVKRKKKVAFVDELEYTPGIRPDSPTLGFSDPASGRTSPCEDIPMEPLPPSVQTMPDVCPAFSPSPSLDGDESSRGTVEEPVHGSRESLERYCTVLSSIQRQIKSHMVTIDRDIAAALTSKMLVPIDEEMRALELRSRIERLRANGWQRKRFDAQRYVEFRERVMSDIFC